MKKINKRIKQKPVVLEQWIEIRRKDGNTITDFYPSNDELEKIRLEMDPPPEVIYRRFVFFQGVPAAYIWTKPSLISQYSGGHFLQRVPSEDWPGLMAKEREKKNTIALSAGRSYARHEALGPCPCVECTRERDHGLPSRLLPFPLA